MGFAQLVIGPAGSGKVTPFDSSPTSFSVHARFNSVDDYCLFCAVDWFWVSVYFLVF
jgi:hypothetical protein